MSFKQLNNTVIPYFTLGDPSIAETERLICRSFDAGVALVEVGIPFSDPIADGPVIQASHFRALASGEDVSIASGLAMVTRIKKNYLQPIVFMMSVNLIIAMGTELFFSKAKEAGLDGVIIPDLPVEEADDFRRLSRLYNIHIVFLVSPLCNKDRLSKIVRASSGFLYVISTTGTTGSRSNVASGLKEFVREIREIRPSIPVAIGFGISSQDHVSEVLSYADAAIVGSHLVNEIHSKGVDSALKEIKSLLPAVSK